MKYISNNGLHELYENQWSPVADHFEEQFAVQFESGKGMGRLQFIGANWKTCCLFMPEVELQYVYESLEAKEEPCAKHLAAVMTSSIGSAIFAEERVKLRWSLYVCKAKTGVEQLIYHDFDPAEEANFSATMKLEVRKLKEAGYSRFDLKTEVFPFGGLDTLMVKIGDVNDAWSYRLESEKEMIGMSCGDLPRMPWEKLLWGESGKVPTVPETVRIPANSLLKQRGCREAALNFLEANADDLSLEDMIKCMKKNKSELVGMYPAWEIDHVFLTEHVQKLLSNALVQHVIRCFPSGAGDDSDKTAASVIEALEQIPKSKQALAMDKDFQRELGSVAIWTQSFDSGVSPSDKEVAKFSALYKAVVHQCTYWCKAEQTEKAKPNSKYFGMPRVLYGKMALEYKYDQCAREEKAKGHIPLGDDLKEFRKYRFLLEPSCRTVVDKWIKASVAKARKAQQGTLCDASAAVTVSKTSEPPTKGGAIEGACCAAGPDGLEDKGIAPAPLKTETSAESQAKVKRASERKIALQALFGMKVKVL